MPSPDRFVCAAQCRRYYRNNAGVIRPKKRAAARAYKQRVLIERANRCGSH